MPDTKPKPSTVSGTYELEYGTAGGTPTILALSPEQKGSLTRQLSDAHPDSTLSDVQHRVVADLIGRKATVKVSAKATPKK